MRLHGRKSLGGAPRPYLVEGLICLDQLYCVGRVCLEKRGAPRTWHCGRAVIRMPGQAGAAQHRAASPMPQQHSPGYKQGVQGVPAGQHMPFSHSTTWPHRLMATAVGRCPNCRLTAAGWAKIATRASIGCFCLANLPRVQQVGQREPLKQKLFQQHDKTYQRRRSTDSAAGIAKGFPHPAATSVGRAAAGLPWHRGLFGRRW